MFKISSSYTLKDPVCPFILKFNDSFPSGFQNFSERFVEKSKHQN